jgi:YD repeat-containing protein
LNIATAKKSGDWIQFNADIPVPSSTTLKNYVLKIGMLNKGTSGAIIIDDFRAHPFDASMVSYVYNSWGELSHVLDNNNMFTRYVYDNMGRLKSTHRETFLKGEVKANENIYHYAGQE